MMLKAMFADPDGEAARCHPEALWISAARHTIRRSADASSAAAAEAARSSCWWSPRWAWATRQAATGDGPRLPPSQEVTPCALHPSGGPSEEWRRARIVRWADGGGGLEIRMQIGVGRDA